MMTIYTYGPILPWQQMSWSAAVGPGLLLQKLHCCHEVWSSTNILRPCMITQPAPGHVRWQQKNAISECFFQLNPIRLLRHQNSCSSGTAHLLYGCRKSNMPFNGAGLLPQARSSQSCAHQQPPVQVILFGGWAGGRKWVEWGRYGGGRMERQVRGGHWQQHHCHRTTSVSNCYPPSWVHSDLCQQNSCVGPGRCSRAGRAYPREREPVFLYPVVWLHRQGEI